MEAGHATHKEEGRMREGTYEQGAQSWAKETCKEEEQVRG
jgi:hypothetical protein